MKESTLAKITASVAAAKGMAQKALASSSNPEWTESEMRSIDEWIAQRRRRARTSADALGHAATAADGRAAGDQHPQHLLAALAQLVEAEKPLPGALQQLR